MRLTIILLGVCAMLCSVNHSAATGDEQEKPEYKITVKKVGEQPTMTMRFRAAPEELEDAYGKAFTTIFAYLAKAGAKPTGPPFGWYHKMRDGKFDIEAGVPVQKAVANGANVQSSNLPAGTVATTIHFGPYDKLGAAHEALQTWARKNGKKPLGGVWEAYLTDPGAELDPQKWQTQLFLPIAAEEAAPNKPSK